MFLVCKERVCIRGNLAGLLVSVRAAVVGLEEPAIAALLGVGAAAAHARVDGAQLRPGAVGANMPEAERVVNDPNGQDLVDDRDLGGTQGVLEDLAASVEAHLQVEETHVPFDRNVRNEAE